MAVSFAPGTATLVVLNCETWALILRFAMYDGVGTVQWALLEHFPGNRTPTAECLRLLPSAGTSQDWVSN